MKQKAKAKAKAKIYVGGSQSCIMHACMGCGWMDVWTKGCLDAGWMYLFLGGLLDLDMYIVR